MFFVDTYDLRFVTRRRRLSTYGAAMALP